MGLEFFYVLELTPNNLTQLEPRRGDNVGLATRTHVFFHRLNVRAAGNAVQGLPDQMNAYPIGLETKLLAGASATLFFFVYLFSNESKDRRQLLRRRHQ